MLKKSCNLIGQEVELATPKQKQLSQILPFLHDYLHGKYLRCGLILFGDIDDQRILQLDWWKVKTGHTQPKVVISDATFA